MGLEHEVRELSADLTRKGHGHAVKRAQRTMRASTQPPATGQALRMQWGNEVMQHPERRAASRLRAAARERSGRTACWVGCAVSSCAVRGVHPSLSIAPKPGGRAPEGRAPGAPHAPEAPHQARSRNRERLPVVPRVGEAPSLPEIPLKKCAAGWTRAGGFFCC